MKKHRIVLTGGGTGGHIYPALSIYEKLIEDGSVESILYVGARGRMEESLCREKKIEFRGLEVSGLPRSLNLNLVKWPLQFLKAVTEARTILSKFDPSCVLGTGGYASAAPLLAGLQLRVPTAVHEPDAHPGLVNRLFSKSANLVSLGMDGARSRIESKSAKIVVNGNPIRESFINLKPKAEALAELGLDPHLKTVIVTGGSQGAQALNNAIASIVSGLLKKRADVQIIHQAGDKNIDELKSRLEEATVSHKRYLLRPYFNDMALVYAASDLAIGRAGAMTISELTVTGTPCIFIPYPYAAQNHQMHNARSLEAQKASFVIDQAELTPANLQEKMELLFDDDQTLDSMKQAMKRLGKPEAAKNLTSQILHISEDYINTQIG